MHTIPEAQSASVLQVGAGTQAPFWQTVDAGQSASVWQPLGRQLPETHCWPVGHWVLVVHWGFGWHWPLTQTSHAGGSPGQGQSLSVWHPDWHWPLTQVVPGWQGTKGQATGTQLPELASQV